MAKSGCDAPKDIVEASEQISKVGFKMFLNITATVANWNKEQTIFSLVFADNPLNDFVQLPEKYKNLNYSNILCGIIRGCLEVVMIKAEVVFVKDTLLGHDKNEIKVTLKEYLKEIVPNDE
jgi:trafficking protein particle complex subunit 3